MNAEEIKRERRLRRIYERLGTDRPVCTICGETTPYCLDGHHIAGRVFAEETVILCCNCHRKITEPQKGHPAKVWSPPDESERIAHWMLGLANLFEMLVATFRAFAPILLECAQRDVPEPEDEQERDQEGGTS